MGGRPKLFFSLFIMLCAFAQNARAADASSTELVSRFSEWLGTGPGLALLNQSSGLASPINLTPVQYGPVTRKPGTVAPVCQLTGGYEQWQKLAGALPTVTPTRSQGLDKGQFGADLGVPITHGSRTVFYFGDTLRVRSKPGGDYLFMEISSSDACNALESSSSTAGCPAWAQTPPNQDAWGTIDSWGYTDDATPGCPTLTWPLNDGGVDSGQLRSTIVWENGAPMNTGGFNVPTGGFSLNGATYLFYSTDAWIKPCPSIPAFMLRSVLAKTTSPVGADPVVLYTASKPSQNLIDLLAQQPCNPPPEGSYTGKFINVGAVVWDGVTPSLPAQSLPFEGPAVFFFGTSWRYRASTGVYLAVVSQSQVDQPGSWHYFQGMSGGKPLWSKDEATAAPIFSGASRGDVMAELSASYNPLLHSWFVMYNGVSVRSAPQPWGPWTPQPSTVFDASGDQGYCHFMHGFADTGTPCSDPGAKPAKIPAPTPAGYVYQICMQGAGGTTYWNSCDLIENNDPRLEPQLPIDSWATSYGAYVVDSYNSPSKYQDSSDVYFVMSTWVPYQAWLMKGTLSAVSLDAFEPNNTVAQATPITPGESYNLSISDPKDIDFLKVTLPAELEAARPKLCVQITHTELNLNLQVTDSSGGTKNSSGPYPSGTSSLEITEPGTWYLRVSGAEGADVGHYSLSTRYAKLPGDCDRIH